MGLSALPSSCIEWVGAELHNNQLHRTFDLSWGCEKTAIFWEKENRRTKIREFCAILQPSHIQHITKTDIFSCGNHTKLFPSVFNTHPSKVQLSPAHYSTFSLQLFNFQPMKVQYSQNPSSTTGDSYINSYYIFVFFVLHASWFENRTVKNSDSSTVNFNLKRHWKLTFGDA